MALSSRKIRLPPMKKPSTRRSRGRVRSMTTIGISPRAPCNWRRSRSAPMIVSTNPIIVNPGVTMYVKMPTYGFENVAIASSRNNRKNENRLPMTMTSPVRLSQLRSSEGCWPEGVGLSALMFEFLCCQSKKRFAERVGCLAPGAGPSVNSIWAVTGTAVCPEDLRYFLNVRM